MQFFKEKTEELFFYC